MNQARLARCFKQSQGTSDKSYACNHYRYTADNLVANFFLTRAKRPRRRGAPRRVSCWRHVLHVKVRNVRKVYLPNIRRFSRVCNLEPVRCSPSWRHVYLFYRPRYQAKDFWIFLKKNLYQKYKGKYMIYHTSWCWRLSHPLKIMFSFSNFKYDNMYIKNVSHLLDLRKHPKARISSVEHTLDI